MSITFYTEEEFIEQARRSLRLGEQVERERIIELLESVKPEDCCKDCESHARDARKYLTHLIALIKGEQK